MLRACVAVGVLLTLAACAGSPEPKSARSPIVQVPPPQADVAPVPEPKATRPPLPGPTIVRADRPLQCVPFARTASGIQIRGDAWTWWARARGAYRRGQVPRPGAVIVLNTGPHRGHLAVVDRVENSRRIIVDHANWLNRGQIHRYTPVVDVSPNNDWSRVRVWYTPNKQLGVTPYKVVGFIYPDQQTAER